MTKINRILETSKRSIGKPSRENLKFDQLIREAIAPLIKRGEIKVPRKKTATLAANPETKRQDYGQVEPTFVPQEERIATFDQDGALRVEHPIYPQVLYCLTAWRRSPPNPPIRADFSSMEPHFDSPILLPTIRGVVRSDRQCLSVSLDQGRHNALSLQLFGDCLRAFPRNYVIQPGSAVVIGEAEQKKTLILVG